MGLSYKVCGEYGFLVCFILSLEYSTCEPSGPLPYCESWSMGQIDLGGGFGSFKGGRARKLICVFDLTGSAKAGRDTSLMVF